MATPAPKTAPAALDTAGLVLLIAILVFAPLFRAGLTPLAGMVAQLLAVALLAVALWTPRRLAALSPVEGLVLALLVLTPLLYLIPLPAGLVNALPGRALYGDALARISALAPGVDPPALEPLSLVPFETASAALAMLLPVAVFIAVRMLDAAGVRRLVKLLLALAALQGLIGLLQFGVAQGGLESAWGIRAGAGGSGTGTYPNRNHLAGLIEMTLPLALALFFYNLGRRSDVAGAGHWSRRAAFWGSATGRAAAVYAAAVLLLLLAVVFTRSRSGIFLSMLGLVLSTAVFARRIGGSNVFGPTGTLVAIGVAGAIAIGLTPVLDRFSLTSMEDDARWTVFELSVQGGGTFFPFGSGPGTFPEVFPLLQPVELGRYFVNRAHNDYLEWIFDAGLLGAALPALVLGLYLYQWTCVYRRGGWSQGRFLQVGAGIGLLLLALHEFVDYNLYTPANQVVFAALAGIFFIPPERLGAPERSRRRRHTPDLEPRAQATPKGPPTPPPEQIRNPFLDD